MVFGQASGMPSQRMRRAAFAAVLLLATSVQCAQRPPCSMLTCFDHARCQANGFTFYVYPDDPDLKPYMERNCTWPSDNHSRYFLACLRHIVREHFTVVDAPDKACLLVPGVDTACALNVCGDEAKTYNPKLLALPTWANGRNHIMLNYMNDAEAPFHFDSNDSIVIRGESTWYSHRYYHDVMAPLLKPTNMRFTPAEVAPWEWARRDLLAYFAGCVYPFCCTARKLMFDVLARAVDSPDVVVTAKCCDQDAIWSSRPYRQRHDYCPGCNGDDIGQHACKHCAGACEARPAPAVPFAGLFNRGTGGASHSAVRHHLTMREGHLRAKFVLCPEGVGPFSYRVTETMEAGAVPIIIGNRTLLPFPEDYSDLWHTCAVLVPATEQAIRGIIPMLRRARAEEWQMRRAACAKLLSLGFGTYEGGIKHILCMLGARVARAVPGFDLGHCRGELLFSRSGL